MSENVFISWSGNGRLAADLMRDMIHHLFSPGLTPWVADTDISPGSEWLRALVDSLQQSRVGVILATSDAIRSSWVMFEAGMIARTATSEARPLFVVDLLLSAEPMPHPLSMFQSLKFDRDGLDRLAGRLNETQTTMLSPEILADRLGGFWSESRLKRLQEAVLNVATTAPRPGAALGSDRLYQAVQDVHRDLLLLSAELLSTPPGQRSLGRLSLPTYRTASDFGLMQGTRNLVLVDVVAVDAIPDAATVLQELGDDFGTAAQALGRAPITLISGGAEAELARLCDALREAGCTCEVTFN